MEAFLLLIVIIGGLTCFVRIMVAIKNQKERNELHSLMKQHPQHAAEIQQAISMRDADSRAEADAFQRRMKAAWKPPTPAKKGGVLGKLVLVALCIGYIIFPIDFIPDVIPVLGWGDDVVAGIIGLKALIK